MNKLKLEKIIKHTCSLVLIARAIQHLFFDSPIRGVLYSPLLMKPFLQLFNIPFDNYINSPYLDNNVNLFLNGLGVAFLMLSAAFLIYPQMHPRIQKVVIFLSVFTLCFLSFAYFKDKSFSIGQFLEYSSQMFLPLFFIIKKYSTLFLKLIIAVTFFAHGLYAIGYYPIPAKFIQMVIMGFHCSNQTALTILKIAGIIDFIFAIAIFIPSISKPFLLYGIKWGFFTAFARIYSNFYIDFAVSTFSYWFYEFIVRSPHYIIPFVLYKQLMNNSLKHSYSS